MCGIFLSIFNSNLKVTSFIVLTNAETKVTKLCLFNFHNYILSAQFTYVDSCRFLSELCLSLQGNLIFLSYFTASGETAAE